MCNSSQSAFYELLKVFSELHFRASSNSLPSDLHLRNPRVHWKNLFGGIQLRVCKCLLVGNSLCFCLCVFFGSYVLANVYWSAIFYTQYPGRTCAHHCMEAKFWVKSNKKTQYMDPSALNYHKIIFKKKTQCAFKAIRSGSSTQSKIYRSHFYEA